MHRTAALVAVLVFASLPAPAGAVGREHSTSAPWFGLRLGGLAAVGSVGGGTPTAGGGGAYALFDARDFLADFSFDLFFGSEARFVAGGLGAYYAFLPGNVTPYAGGGLKVGWTRFGGDGAFGVIPYAAAGLLVGRQYYPQLRVELSWFVNTSLEQRGADQARANGLMATLGLAF
jgi:hypothetical protein